MNHELTIGDTQKINPLKEYHISKQSFFIVNSGLRFLGGVKIGKLQNTLIFTEDIRMTYVAIMYFVLEEIILAFSIM